MIFFMKILLIMLSCIALDGCQQPQNLATINHYQQNNQISVHQNSWSKESALNELVNMVHMTIQKKHPYFPFLGEQAEVALDIVTIANDSEWIIFTHSFIDRLREKSNVFNQSIKYCIEQAKNNYDTVTSERLDIIKNSKETQHFAVLNEIPSTIRQYCMNYAYSSITHEYNLELSFPAVLIDMTICSSLDIAAVATDDTIFLWDLKTNNTEELTSSNNINYISLAFNKKGSILAVIEHLNHGHTITFWKVNSKKIIAKQQLAFTIEAIKASKKNNRTFHVYVKDSITQTSLPIGNVSIILHSISTHRPHEPLWKTYGNYTAPNIKRHLLPYSVAVMKSGCRDLFLCLRAVENSKPNDYESMQKITTSMTYSLLTRYEQSLIDKKITERYRALF